MPKRRLRFAPEVSYGGNVYDLERAKSSVTEMSAIGYRALVKSLFSPGETVELKYPGIGPPGGDITYVTRMDFKAVYNLVHDNANAGGDGHVVYVTGTKGIGKSCYLRALAWVIILSGEGVICLWNSADACLNIVAALVAALRFTYCQDDVVLDQIDNLRSEQDVWEFIKTRAASGDVLYLIVDGADNVTSYKGRHKAVNNYLQQLAKLVHVTVFCVSPAADVSQSSSFVRFHEGFWKNEYETYMQTRSPLGKLTWWEDDIDYFAGNHPLSLFVLDDCCRQSWAQSRRVDGAKRLKSPTNEQIVELLQDKSEWEEVLKLFVSSPEISSMKDQLHRMLKGLNSAVHSPSEMMERDRRFVKGDPAAGDAVYVTPYIGRLHVEAFRDAENNSLFKGAAWYNYCRYLLQDTKGINWCEMGWLCENLVAETISTRGLSLDGLTIWSTRIKKFGTVPRYRSLVQDVSDAVRAIYLIPLKYNYRDIDGLILWKDPARVLHLFAIQVTINPDKHRPCADDFMSFNAITQWIPEAELDKWKLHYVFLCVDDRPTLLVSDERKITRSVTYGTVCYHLHTLSFAKAFAGPIHPDVRKTLEEVAMQRYNALEPVAEKKRRNSRGSGFCS